MSQIGNKKLNGGGFILESLKESITEFKDKTLNKILINGILVVLIFSVLASHVTILAEPIKVGEKTEQIADPVAMAMVRENINNIPVSANKPKANPVEQPAAQTETVEVQPPQQSAPAEEQPAEPVEEQPSAQAPDGNEDEYETILYTVTYWNDFGEVVGQESWTEEHPVWEHAENKYSDGYVYVPENSDGNRSGYVFEGDENYEAYTPSGYIDYYDPFCVTGYDAETFDRILSGTGMDGLGYAVTEMEQRFGVSGMFCLGVARAESSLGDSWAGYSRNNYFGFMSGGSIISFASGYDSIMYFGELMNCSYYYGKSIEEIAVIYCDYSWSYLVRSCISTNASYL